MGHRPYRVSEDLVQRLIAAKCLVSTSLDAQKDAAAMSHQLKILQDGSLVDSRAIELDCGGTAYTIGVYVGCDLGAITIYKWELELPWQDSQFRWLDDPEECAQDPSLYTLPGFIPLTFAREMVINHRRLLTRGHSLRGLLLGYGYESIPDRYRHGSSIEVKLSLVDQVGRSFPSSFSLRVDRMVSSRPKRKISNRGPLLDRPDQPNAKRPVELREMVSVTK
jgi:hypothetical protein